MRLKSWEKVIVPAIVALLTAGFGFLQFKTAYFFDSDSYYHIFSTIRLASQGVVHQFPWAKLSVFNAHYADKDFLFHLLIVPFTFISSDPIIAGKIAIVFFNFVFLSCLAWILSKYVSKVVTAILLVLLVSMPPFQVMFSLLRPASLANIFLILALYWMIQRQWLKVFLVTFFYALSHISFFTLAFFLIIVEAIRYAWQKQICLKNISAVVSGLLLGILINPYFPDNIRVFMLNAIVVPVRSLVDNSSSLAREFRPLTTKEYLLDNFMMVFALAGISVMMILGWIKKNFVALIWWACAMVYFGLSLLSARYVYQAEILLIIFLAAYLSEFLKEINPDQKKLLRTFVIIFLVLGLWYGDYIRNNLKNFVDQGQKRAKHYETVSGWIKQNIAAKETIYHANWDDSPYFTYFNPDNYYLVILDPIFMFAYDPKAYGFYEALRQGQTENPYEFLRQVFKVKYGYSRKINKRLCWQIQNNPSQFKVIYQDNYGLVFELIEPARQ